MLRLQDTLIPRLKVCNEQRAFIGLLLSKAILVFIGTIQTELLWGKIQKIRPRGCRLSKSDSSVGRKGKKRFFRELICFKICQSFIWDWQVLWNLPGHTVPQHNLTRCCSPSQQLRLALSQYWYPSSSERSESDVTCFTRVLCTSYTSRRWNSLKRAVNTGCEYRIQ